MKDREKKNTVSKCYSAENPNLKMQDVVEISQLKAFMKCNICIHKITSLTENDV